MPTTDLFTLPHKALRSVFGSTATEIGAYDVAEGGSSVAVAALAHEIVEVAHAHGAHEDEFIVPLLARHLPHLEQQLRAEHERLVVTFDSVQRHADIFAGAPSGPAQLALFRHVRRAEAANLAHLDLEESLVMPAIWQVVPDEEVLAVLQAFKAAHPEAVDLYRRAPQALTTPERALVLG